MIGQVGEGCIRGLDTVTNRRVRMADQGSSDVKFPNIEFASRNFMKE